jgi:renalase
MVTHYHFMSSTLLIGAGMTGLTAARELVKQGHSVTILDKGRGVGGRMATRRIDQSRNDHGAQYFTARSPEFQSLVEELLTAGVVGIWPVGNGSDHHTHYIGRDGMSAVAKYLAQSLNIRTGERVVRIEKIDQNGQFGWRAITETNNTYEADNLLLTMPAPQILTLLHDSGIGPDEVDLEALQQIQYAPCIAVMAVLNEPTRLPTPGGYRPTEGPVSWVADNYQKGISPQQPSVTVHATPEFSRIHFDDDPTTTEQLLLDTLSDFIPPETILTYQVHRWRYSLVEKAHAELFLRAKTPAPLLFGGDGFWRGSVEGAFLSGRKLSEQITAIR